MPDNELRYPTGDGSLRDVFPLYQKGHQITARNVLKQKGSSTTLLAFKAVELPLEDPSSTISTTVVAVEFSPINLFIRLLPVRCNGWTIGGIWSARFRSSSFCTQAALVEANSDATAKNHHADALGSMDSHWEDTLSPSCTDRSRHACCPS